MEKKDFFVSFYLPGEIGIQTKSYAFKTADPIPLQMS